MAEGNSSNLSGSPNNVFLDEWLDFGDEDASYLNQNTIFNPTEAPSATGTNLQIGTFNMTVNSYLPATFPESPEIQLQEGLPLIQAPISGEHHENWGEFNMADSSFYPDTSADVDGDLYLQVEMGQSDGDVVYDSGDRSNERNLNLKKLRRRALNREAARKCRLKKKRYIQKLEKSQLKLNQLEQERLRASQQGTLNPCVDGQSHTTTGIGPMAFDAEYARWLEEHDRHIDELRKAVTSHASDSDLRSTVHNVATHFSDKFRLKGTAAKADVLHILSGIWRTPAERCFMWIGGFRPSELLKLLANHLVPLAEQQLVDIHNLEQLSRHAEEDLTLQMQALQLSLAETLVNGMSDPESSLSGNVAVYMGQMCIAMEKLVSLEGFLHQADNLRLHILQQMHYTLTLRQSAQALLLMHDYFSRVRALGTLWMTKPRE